MRTNRRVMAGRTYTHNNGGDPIQVAGLALLVNGQPVFMGWIYSDDLGHLRTR